MADKIFDLSKERIMRKGKEHLTYKSIDGNIFLSESLRDQYDRMIQAKEMLSSDFNYVPLEGTLVISSRFLIEVINLEHLKRFVELYRISLGKERLQIDVEVMELNMTDISGKFIVDEFIEKDSQGRDIITLYLTPRDTALRELRERIDEVERF